MERSIRKYGKSPKEVSFFERSITGHPAFNYDFTLGRFNEVKAAVFRSDVIYFGVILS